MAVLLPHITLSPATLASSEPFYFSLVSTRIKPGLIISSTAMPHKTLEDAFHALESELHACFSEGDGIEVDGNQYASVEMAMEALKTSHALPNDVPRSRLMHEQKSRNSS